MYATAVEIGLLVGLLTVTAGAVYDSSAGFWDPIHHTRFPCPVSIRREVPTLAATGYPFFVDTHGDKIMIMILKSNNNQSLQKNIYSQCPTFILYVLCELR